MLTGSTMQLLQLVKNGIIMVRYQVSKLLRVALQYDQGVTWRCYLPWLRLLTLIYWHQGFDSAMMKGIWLDGAALQVDKSDLQWHNSA